MQYTTHRRVPEVNVMMKTSFLPRPARVIKPSPTHPDYQDPKEPVTRTQNQSRVESNVGVDWAIDTGPVEDFIPQYKPFPQAQDPRVSKRTK